MKTLILTVLFSFLFSCGLCQSNNYVENKNLVNGSVNNTTNKLGVVQDTYFYTDEEIIDSYRSVIEYARAAGSSATLSFDLFKEALLARNVDIELFSKAVGKELVENENLFNKLTLRSSDVCGLLASSSPDADYILTSTNNETFTPSSYFKRDLVYNGYDGKTFDYGSLKPGDIIFEDVAPFGHSAIISDVSHSTDDGKTYIQTIEAVGSGVKFGFLDDKRMVDYNVKLIKVADIEWSDRTFIVNFCLSQIGKPYSCQFNDVDWSSSNPDWYCSELVYAAYYSTNIDLGMHYEDYRLETFGVIFYPSSLMKAYNTYEISSESRYYPSFLIEQGNYWTVRIYNNSNINSTFYYNSKMCFGNDAEQWRNLNDVKNVYIYDTEYAKVNISQNWFATDIAISNIYNGKRYITFASSLMKDTYKSNFIKYNTLNV